MFEAAIVGQYPATFPSETLARDYVAQTPVDGVRPWIRHNRNPIFNSFIVISGRDVESQESRS
jgi:hypothetical protein